MYGTRGLHSNANVCSGERQELSDLLDTATQRVDRLETANVQHGNKEASLKDKVGPPRFRSMECISNMQDTSISRTLRCSDGIFAVTATYMHLFA